MLLGTQGVGKNKLADRFCEIMRLPRRYIQLHRDTSIQSLTVTPSIKNGHLVYEDSPLVLAATQGLFKLHAH
jgi:MoxR-like ATPase